MAMVPRPDRAPPAVEFRAILFVPKKRGWDWVAGPEKKSSLDLYVRRVLIQHDMLRRIEPIAFLRVSLSAEMAKWFGVLPGGGAAQHLARIMGRARALEVMLSAGITRRSWLNDTGGSIERCLPLHSVTSSDRSLTGSPAFRPPVTPWSRTGSMR